MHKEKPSSVSKDLGPLSKRLSELESKKPVDTDNSSLLHEERRARIESFRQNTEERKVYARETFKLIRAYLIVVASLLFLVGFVPLPFYFSDTVIVTLLTTTTTTVIGIFLLVMQYLFRKGNRSR